MTAADTRALPGVPARRPATVLLACGHESDGGSALRRAAEAEGMAVVPGAGRELLARVTEALSRQTRPVVVVPMTLGRDPGLVADCARALRWAGGGTGRGGLALAPPFGTLDHLTAWLRSAALKASQAHTADRSIHTDRCALLVTAPAGGPFVDADLFRVARLVHQYGIAPMVEVAFDGGDPDLDSGVSRCRRLGAEEVWLLRAAFAAPARLPEGLRPAGPLLSDAAIVQVVRARVREALARLDEGDDGVAAGAGAEHGRGYAHGHAHTDDHPHPHSPAPGAPPAAHGHGHLHAHARPHDHGPAPDLSDGRLPGPPAAPAPAAPGPGAPGPGRPCVPSAP
ncbi:cobalamin biosynthesis protein CbiX [Streptomyces sp. NPDC089919]|uniref:sirohydrochlorin chelatase n=1 Tax=Streptomyces sp. NPDC089919 TaxID=3155188 RepID=UPI00344369A0